MNQTVTQAAATPPGLGGPAGIRIRMYRVGFGDFFLLSVAGADGEPHHILIDCGVHAANLNSIGDAIAQLGRDTGNKLALVIVTHRHADHISGFGTGKDAFATFTVERVWMPWFEDPANAKAAAFQAGITALAEQLHANLAAREDDASKKLAAMMGNITGVMGAAGAPSGNALALQVLHEGFANTPSDVRYYKAGDLPALPQSLIDAGLSAEILGPPIDEALVAEMDGKTHQYLDAAQAADATTPKPRPFAAAFDAAPDPSWAGILPDGAIAAVETRVKSVQPDMFAAQAKRADNSINNQSLVVLFRKAGKSLLFAGDAQWGNWQNFLFGGELGTPGHTTLTDHSKAILGSLDFYKVGHHGSTNATPIDALQAMRDGCVAMCSTEPGAYGSEKNDSEVPRAPLMTAIDQKTQHQLARSDQVAVPGAEVFATPLPGIFKTTGKGYIDYEL